MTQRRLRVVQGPMAGREIGVDGELVIGRGQPGSGSLGQDENLSRRHAVLRVDAAGQVTVEDLGSTNGTLVNGLLAAGSVALRDGDEVVVGASRLRLEPAARDVVPGAPGATAPAGGGRGAEPAPRTLHASRAELAGGPVAGGWTPPAGGGPGFGQSGPFGPSGPSAPPYLAPGAGSASMRRGRVGLLVAAVLVLALAGGAVAGYAYRGSSSVSASSVPGRVGTVYVESNLATPGGNSILAYDYGAQGNLNPVHITAYPTGGMGSADLTDSGVLDADQHVLLNPSRTLLFAVNQGSDTIAVFHVHKDGSLAAVSGSPFPSGGAGPASVGLSGSTLVVVNKAQDGVRKLDKTAPVYRTMRVSGDGVLTPTGSSIKAPNGFSPTQALISPSGHVVFSTEEGGPLRAFTLGSDGALKQGPNSPLSPPESIFPKNFPSSKKWALGLGVSPTQKLLYAEMATVNKIAVYRYDENARLTFLTAVDNKGGDLPCWTLVNPTGDRIYTDNAGNNTMTVYDVSDPQQPKQIQLVHLKHDGNPWDVHFDPTGKVIFMIDPRARMNVKAGKGNEIHTLLVNPDGTLTEPATSPVPIPVGLDVNPIGITAS